MNTLGTFSMMLSSILLIIGMLIFSATLEKSGLNNIGSYMLLASLCFAYLADKNKH